MTFEDAMIPIKFKAEYIHDLAFNIALSRCDEEVGIVEEALFNEMLTRLSDLADSLGEYYPGFYEEDDEENH